METNQNNNCSHGVCMNDGVRKSAIVALGLLSLFLLAVSIGEFKKIPTIGNAVPSLNTINVSGTGEVVAVPDIATFTFSVTEESALVSDAQTKSAKAINDIIAYLTKNGIDKKDIKTTGYNIYPRYEYYGTSSYYPSGKQTLAAYVVSQSVQVKVRKIADAGKILGGLGELGATDVSGLTFGFDKDDTLKAEARANAIAKAKSQATAIARDLGVSLGKIISYNESGSNPIIYGRGGDMMLSKVSASVPEITPGESKITSTVSITYEIR